MVIGSRKQSFVSIFLGGCSFLGSSLFSLVKAKQTFGTFSSMDAYRWCSRGTMEG